MVVIVSLVVQLGLYPLQVYYFGEVSIISPVANAIFIPFMGVIVPLALVGVVVGSVIPVLGKWLCLGPDLFLQFMNQFVLWIADFSWAWRSVRLESMWIFPLWISMILSLASWRIPRLRWKWVSIFLGLLVVVQIQDLWRQYTSKDMSVTIFDVGQGDAALITTPNGKHILIDTGVWTPSGNSAETILLPHFKAEGIKKLNAVVLSHPHADHIGGIITLLESIPIDTIYNSGFEYDSQLYRGYMEMAARKQVPVKAVHAGDLISVDEAVLIMVYSSGEEVPLADPNQHSVILELVYGDTEFLFTGDAGQRQESRVLTYYSDLLDTDFLKVGHHGSRTSSGKDFLEQLSPDIAVVSLAEQNRYNHPHAEAVQRLHQTNAEIYYTSRDKALVFKSDGEKIWRKAWD